MDLVRIQKPVQRKRNNVCGQSGIHAVIFSVIRTTLAITFYLNLKTEMNLQYVGGVKIDSVL